MDLNNNQVDCIRAHMAGYQLGDLAAMMDPDSNTPTSGNIFSLGNIFLNVPASIENGLVESGSDFLFWITAAPNDSTNFSGNFPAMAPFDAFGAGDCSDFPFPNLAGVAIDKINWTYLFFSTTDIDIRNTLWKMYSGNQQDWTYFQQLSAPEYSSDDILIPWEGGLYYAGNFIIPWDQLMPADITPPPWQEFIQSAGIDLTKFIPVNGCLYQQGVVDYMKMRVALVSKDDPFGDGLIKNIALFFELSTALSEMSDSLSRFDNMGENRVGLGGTIQIGSGTPISVSGSWPIDGDEVIINASCQSSDLTALLGSDIPWPTSIEVAFIISKSQCTLEKIMFECELAADWQLVNFLSLSNVTISTSIISPGSMSLVSADFNATAKIGSNSPFAVNCSGNYPSGSLSLSLDPSTPIKVSDIINSLFQTEIGLSDAAITQLGGSYDGLSDYISFGVTISDPISLNLDSKTGFQLSNLTFSVYGNSSDGYTLKLAASLAYTFTTGSKQTVKFQGGATYGCGGWIFDAACQVDGGGVSLTDIATEFGFSSPKQLNGLALTGLGLTIVSGDSGIKQFTIAGTLDLFAQTGLDFALQVNHTTDITAFSGNFTATICGNQENLKVNFVENAGGYQLDVSLLLEICGIGVQLLGKKDSTTGQASDAQGSIAATATDATGTTDANDDISTFTFSGGTSNLSIHINDILDHFSQLADEATGIDFKSIIPSHFLPDIDICDIYVLYDGSKGQTNFVAVANVENQQINVYFQRTLPATEGATPVYVFGINTNFGNLSDLPMVGDSLADVHFTGVGFVYVHGAGTDNGQDFYLPIVATTADSSVGSIQLLGQSQNFNDGFHLTGAVTLPPPGTLISIEAAVIPSTRPADSGTQPSSNPGPAAPAPPASFQPGAQYFDIDKSIGPVKVSKLGYAFDESEQLSLLVTGAVTLSGLNISLDGLGVKFPLAVLLSGNFSLSDATPQLAGLGISFNNPPVAIGGAFVQTEPKPNTTIKDSSGNLDPQYDEAISFIGAAQFSTSAFTISGIGAYAKLKNGTSSLFVYGAYFAPIGGPAFFFVTGIAAGFGYNKSVRVPALQDVPQFPLVSMVLSSDQQKSIGDVLSDLESGQWVPSTPGEYWLAVGIKFTSFKIIDSFVLLTAQFGVKVEFAVIGLSLLKWPGGGTPIAYIELAVLATFGPDSDVIAVTGALTPNSYILDTNCKLTGGFAFYTWVSGEHEGDFVVTLGGYSPQYTVPDHYPAVDRLALNWKFSDLLQIHGEMYFALTPKAMMAGGRWEVKYDLSFLSASVIYWADIIVYWAPFHYQADGGLIVRIEANIKILFVHIHFSVQMSCEIYIQGPPFGGHIYVDWTIFSFTIHFGDSANDAPPPLLWTSADGGKTAGFIESFVPRKDDGSGNTKEHPLDLRFVDGIIDDHDGSTFVNPYKLALAVDSFFPVTNIFTDLTATTSLLDCPMYVAGADSPMLFSERNQAFGIKPMNMAGIVVELCVNVTSITQDNTQDNTSSFQLIPLAKGASGALWSPAGLPDDPNNVSENILNDVDVIKNVCSGIHLLTKAHPDEIPTNVPLTTQPNNPSVSLYYLTNLQYDGHTSESDLRADLVGYIKDTGAISTAISALGLLGYDLYTPDVTSFDELEMRTPLFIPGIGMGMPGNEHK